MVSFVFLKAQLPSAQHCSDVKGPLRRRFTGCVQTLIAEIFSLLENIHHDTLKLPKLNTHLF